MVLSFGARRDKDAPLAQDDYSSFVELTIDSRGAMKLCRLLRTTVLFPSEKGVMCCALMCSMEWKMPTYVSMLRGINVSGQKTIKMRELKLLYESIAFSNVTTYIQSGNVIFRARSKDSRSTAKSIENAIEKSFRFRPAVIIRQPSDLGRVIDACPFNEDESKLHVTFLGEKPSPGLVKELASVTLKTDDEYKLIGSEIYLHCPDGYGKTPLSNSFFEKQLMVTATTRNWKTVNTLFVMASQDERK